MSYDEEQARRSRVVVDTPTERREVVHTQTVRGEDRSGISAGMVGVLVVVAIALITMLVLFWMSSQPATDTATTAAQPTTAARAGHRHTASRRQHCDRQQPAGAEY
jgi:hypothetical protein